MASDSAHNFYEEMYLISRRPTRLSIEMLERIKKNEETGSHENKSSGSESNGSALNQNNIT